MQNYLIKKNIQEHQHKASVGSMTLLSLFYDNTLALRLYGKNKQNAFTSYTIK